MFREKRVLLALALAGLCAGCRLFGGGADSSPQQDVIVSPDPKAVAQKIEMAAQIVDDGDAEENVAGLIDELVAAKIRLFNYAFEAAIKDAAGSPAPVMTEFLSDKWPQVRKHALSRLPEMGRERCVQFLPAIVGMLDRESDDVRVVAIEVVGSCFLPDNSISEALEKMVKDDSSDVRRAAVEAAGKLGLTEVIMLALSDNDGLVLMDAVKKIGHVKEKNAVDKLIKLYSSSPDPKLRNAVLVALADIGESAKSAGFLVDLIRSYPGFEDTWFAIDTLGKVGTYDAEAAEMLFGVIAKGNQDLTLISLCALANVRAQRSAEILSESLVSQADPKAKEAALASLRQLADRLAKDKSWQSAAYCAKAILKTNPADPALKSELARILFMAGDVELASKTAFEVVSSAEKFSNAWFEAKFVKAEAAFSAGDARAASEELVECLSAPKIDDGMRKRTMQLKDRFEPVAPVKAP